MQPSSWKIEKANSRRRTILTETLNFHRDWLKEKSIFAIFISFHFHWRHTNASWNHINYDVFWRWILSRIDFDVLYRLHYDSLNVVSDRKPSQSMIRVTIVRVDALFGALFIGISKRQWIIIVVATVMSRVGINNIIQTRPCSSRFSREILLNGWSFHY